MRLKIAVSVVQFRPWAPHHVRFRSLTFADVHIFKTSQRVKSATKWTRSRASVGTRWHRWYICWHHIRGLSPVPAEDAMLNDTRIRNARPTERDYKLTDFDGLYLLVRRNGSRLWRFAYRLGGKQKQIALGAYPGVTLADARDRREAARRLLASGKDPSVERRLEKIGKAAGGNTFREVAEEFLDKQGREGRSEATLSKNRWLLEPALAAFGDRPIGEVTAPELLHALQPSRRSATDRSGR
jgi:hypothetical protein